MKFRHALTVAGLAVAATLVPAMPAAADSTSEHAHAGFRSNDSSVSLDVDVSRINGIVKINAEWADDSCETTDTIRVCNWIFRNAYDVPVTHFHFTLEAAAVTAELPYQELRRTCTYHLGEDESETCTEQEDSRTTTLRVTWTSVGNPEHSEWTDEAGTRYLTTSAYGTVAGTGFGTWYGGSHSFGQLARVRHIPAGTV
ncbi:hypothetical protein GCM10027280_40070 [Micromonospora polyrhachis]|uniref:Secreted protein n=1 Tax=Micromonospora polyrhachis TaxID=1282883 RepID=A0A7W7SL00_9ACTN|nr:hypothetical protein [Micromonospora polyrhachis]MBB4956707.1 hypothetical protein [Micromonospora polyrhachis]